MFDVAGDLDALGGELCGLAHGGGNNIDALGQALDYALGNGKGVLRCRRVSRSQRLTTIPGITCSLAA